LNTDIPNPRLKLLPLIEAKVQTRKSTEAKAVAAKKDRQLRGFESGKRAEGAFSLSI
jgi:ribosome assembly protein YihI (activator of Der GTPase)